MKKPHYKKLKDNYSASIESFIQAYRANHTFNSVDMMKRALSLWPELAEMDPSTPCKDILSGNKIDEGLQKLCEKKVNGNPVSPNTILSYIQPILRFKNLLYPNDKNSKKLEDKLKELKGKKTFKLKNEPFADDIPNLEKVSPLDMRLACILAYEMGLKPDEMVYLRKKDFYEDHLNCGKRQRNRKVKYGSLLKRFLQNHSATIFANLKKPMLFQPIRSGRRMKVGTLKWKVRKSLESAGMKGLNLMVLRRNGILQAMKKNISQKKMQSKLGFSKKQAIQRYNAKNKKAIGFLTSDWKKYSGGKPPMSHLMIELAQSKNKPH